MAEVIPLKDGQLKRILSYPHYSEGHYQKVVKDLRAMGVEGIISMGNVDINDLRVVGKGCVGIVFAGILNGERVALKVLRSDSNRASLGEEEKLLLVANRCGVGPRLIASSDSAIAMEYIDGKYLSKWLEEPHTTEEVRYVARKLLSQCYRLDKEGLDHGELSDAKKHILVDERGRPHILDFETASMNRKCRNLVSMLSYLFFKGSISILMGRYLCWDGSAIRNLIREYKDSPSKAVYEKIISGLGLYRIVLLRGAR